MRLDGDVGSLAAGKQADLIAVRAVTPRTTPSFDAGPHAKVHPHHVHAVRGSDVDLTVVDGAVLVRDGRLVTADLSEIVDRARRVVPGLFARRTAWLAEHDLSDSPLG